MTWRVAMVLLLVPVARAGAHSFEPALLDLRERTAGVFDVVWKAPAAGSGALAPGAPPLVPELPAHCLRRAAPWTGGDDPEAPRWFRLDCGATGLAGQRITVAGIEESRVDAIVRIAWANGRTTTGVLHAAAPVLVVPASGGGLGAGVVASAVLRAYVALGVAHILLGWDHLAFVLGLLLLVRSWGMLVRTITAFTVAHSLTLALAVLGAVTVPPAPVEALIAASIVLLARELLRPPGVPATVTQRAPWVVAFAFGLLHGLGFAGALSEIGLPPDQVPLALLAFNVGVEIGQLAFVAMAAIPVVLARRVIPQRSALRQAPAYALGAVASAWTLARIARFWLPPG
ncbi:MAG: HupE/UreJ family protein [Candidatus Binatia bacterium]